MPIGDVCVRDVVIADRSTTIQKAAQLMRQHHVGNVVIVDELNNPTGIVTDRDIVISVVATKLDSEIFTLGDLVMQDLITAPENQGIFETIQQMRTRGIRRLPIVNSAGELVGIVSVDDLIQLLAVEMNELGNLIAREQAREISMRR